jgi:hypothetical protein
VAFGDIEITFAWWRRTGPAEVEFASQLRTSAAPPVSEGRRVDDAGRPDPRAEGDEDQFVVSKVNDFATTCRLSACPPPGPRPAPRDLDLELGGPATI